MESVIKFSKKEGTLEAKFWQIRQLRKSPIKQETIAIFAGYTTEDAYNSAPESPLAIYRTTVKYYKNDGDVINAVQKQIDEKKEE